MTKSTRNLLVLVGSVAILSLVLFAVGPVLAQSGTGGANGQGGNTVVVSSSDTLGTLVTRYNLSGSNLRDFLSLNANLPLVPGQRVTFPPGITVNIPTTGQGTQGTNGSQSQSAASTSTPAATVAATVATTGTPAATTAANNSSSSSSSNSSSSTSSNSTSSNSSANTSSNAQAVRTYVVKQGDTLGTILNMMGFQASGVANTGSTAATSTPMATVAATVASTATPMATTAATATSMATTAATATSAATVAATGTPAASTAATATPMATTAATATSAATVAATATSAATTASTATPVATTASNSSSSTAAGGPTDAQLQQFVRLNSTLRFGVVVSLPAGVPATGGTSGTNGTSGTSGSNGTSGTSGSNNGANNTSNSNSNGVSNRLSTLSGQAASNLACSTNAPKGFGYYKIRGGDTLQSISTNFKVPVSTILQLNRGSAFAKGNIILLPGVEAPGHWDVKSMCPNGTSSSNNKNSTTSNNTTGAGVATVTVAPTAAAATVTPTATAKP